MDIGVDGEGKPMLQAIIFDLDGVLVDSEPIDREAWVKVLGRYGVHASEHDLMSLTGKPAMDVLKYYRQRTNKALTDTILVEKHELFYELAKVRLTSMPGVEKFIRYLRNAGILLAVASSSSLQRIMFSLTHISLYSYFHAVCNVEEVANPKPAPDVFLHVASKLMVGSKSCVVIEDSIHGITAAKMAGM